MILYRYKAAGINGILHKGMLRASSTSDLKKHMQMLGLSLISYSTVPSFVFSRKIKHRTLMDLCLHLEYFENAGIPLTESLKELCQLQTSHKLKNALITILKDVEEGSLFSTALAKHSSIFDSIFIELIDLGEKTGRLSFVFQQLFQYLKWMDEIQAQTFKALRYPLFMGSILLGVIIILMTILVPELAKFIESFAGNLPPSTRFLLFLSCFLSNNLFWILSSTGIGIFVAISGFKFHPKGPYWKDRLLDLMPFIGPLRRKIALTRFCHIFAVMFESGIDIMQALQTARQYLKYGQLYHDLETVERFIIEGTSLSQAFQKGGMFPSIAIQMIKIGERTSSLHKTLFHIKEYFDTSLKRQVDHIVGLLEPIMILCLGCIMAWIIFSIFLPLYDTFSILDY